MNKQEAITLLEKLRTFHNGTYAKSIDMAIEALQAEPVVRCKDCRYCEYCEEVLWCNRTEEPMKEDDFCSYGERRK